MDVTAMRSQVFKLARSCNGPKACFRWRSSHYESIHSKRYIQIHATPTSVSPNADSLDSTSSTLTPPTDAESPDARFEVLGSTSSLLSVSLSASQNLYTRRGTLVGVNGSPDNTISSLSPLSPVRRAPLGVPFLYQKVVSSAPLNLLIATRSPHTSFAVLHMDGRQDWTVVQRKGLLAWTGHRMEVEPAINTQMSLAHWGNTLLTGRGLVALAATGQVFQVALKTGEQYIAHPSNILAYSINPTLPQPFRFRSTALRLQIPNLGSWFPDTAFFRNMRSTKTYKAIVNFFYQIRIWGRRTIFGDRLFMRFHGPTTLLLQSRGSSLREVLNSKDMVELADAPAGVLETPKTVSLRPSAGSGGSNAAERPQSSGKVTYASVGRDGKVEFTQSS